MFLELPLLESYRKISQSDLAVIGVKGLKNNGLRYRMPAELQVMEDSLNLSV